MTESQLPPDSPPPTRVSLREQLGGTPPDPPDFTLILPPAGSDAASTSPPNAACWARCEDV